LVAKLFRLWVTGPALSPPSLELSSISLRYKLTALAIVALFHDVFGYDWVFSQFWVWQGVLEVELVHRGSINLAGSTYCGDL